jgi:hypothetical protein
MNRSFTVFGAAVVIAASVCAAQAQETANPATPPAATGSDQGVSGALKPLTPSERTNPSTTGAARSITPPDPGHPFGRSTEGPPNSPPEPRDSGKGTK